MTLCDVVIALYPCLVPLSVVRCIKTKVYYIWAWYGSHGHMHVLPVSWKFHKLLVNPKTLKP